MKRITKIIACFGVMALLLGQLTGPLSTIRAEETMESATDFVSHMNIGWNLGNTFDAYGTWISGSSPSSYETAWGNVSTTKAMIDSVKEQGFNTIRIPITWAQHIDGSGNIDEAWLVRVKEVVDYAYNDGLYVIINTHHDGGEGGGDKVSWLRADTSVYSSTKEKFAALWINIANVFKDYDDHLIFEGYNELIDSGNTWDHASNDSAYDAVNSYAQLFVDTVRATGGNNLERNLIVQTYVGSWTQSVLDRFTVPADTAEDHLICAVHSYTPWGFTGTSATVNWTPVHNDFQSSDKSEIDSCISQIAAFRDRIGIPVIIGEFGAENKNNEDQIELYVQYFVDKAGSQGLKCIYWDNGIFNDGTKSEGYAIFNRSSLTWKTGITEALIGAAAPYVTENTEAVTEETSETTAKSSASEESSSDVSRSQSETSAPAETEDPSAELSVPQGQGASKMPPVLMGFIIFDIVAAAAFFTVLVIYLTKKKNSKKN